MQCHDRLDDREPEAVGFGVSAACRVASVEAIEQAPELFGRNGRPFVLDRYRRDVAVLRAEQPHRRPSGAVAHCVHDEVVDRAPTQGRIDEGHAGGLHVELKAALIGRPFEVFGDLLKLSVQRNRCPLDRQRSMVDLREEQDVLRNLPQPVSSSRFDSRTCWYSSTLRARCSATCVCPISAPIGMPVSSPRSAELRKTLVTRGNAVKHRIERDDHLLHFERRVMRGQPNGEIDRVDQGRLRCDSAQRAAALSPDNRHLALSGMVTQTWDVENSRLLADVSPPFGGSTSLSFSGDGNWLATADGDGHVRVFDAATGKPRSSGTEFALEPLAVAFSKDNKAIIAGGVDKTVSVIDPETGKVLRTLSKQPGLILSLDVSADKKQVAVIYGSADSFGKVDRLILWDLGTEAVLADFRKPGITILGGAFVGDHYLFAATSDTQIGVWSLR